MKVAKPDAIDPLPDRTLKTSSPALPYSRQAPVSSEHSVIWVESSRL